MLKRAHDVKVKQQKLFIGLFVFSTFLSFIDLFSFIKINIYPEYFIALMVLTISSNLISMTIIKVFLIGFIVDILIGSILGQYTLTFLFLYGLQVFYQKYFLMPSKAQSILLRFMSVSLSILVINIISQNFDFDYYSNGSLLNSLLIQIVCTFFVLIIFQIFYEKTYST